MKEYIDREAVFHAMKMDIRPPFAVVRDFPAADVVEVVRCRDCRRCEGFHGNQVEPGEVGICKINQMAVGPDSFCSWGIRRE